MKIVKSKWLKNLTFLDKYGYPVERVRGRWFFNFLRILIHTKRIARFVQRKPKTCDDVICDQQETK